MTIRSIMEGVRWAFKFSSWRPTPEQWMFAAQCVQKEEKERIGRFYFQKDGKSAMAGRLLIRKVIHDKLKIPYKEIQLARTEKNKPYLKNLVPERFLNFNFNVSHQGEYAVLAAEPVHQVGIDVMQVETPTSGVKTFFGRMERQFTYQEWKAIKRTPGEWDQLCRFYRIWCLKESYVKALGVGIGFDLSRIDFHIHTYDIEPGTVVTDTKVYVDEELDNDWTFEETVLDGVHHVAVATHHKSEANSPQEAVSPPTFHHLSFEELIEGAQPLSSEPDHTYWQTFSQKPEGRAVRQS